MLALYLNNIHKISSEIESPRNVIRNACQANLINDDESILMLEMIDSRNRTSHIYKEEIADNIAKMIPKFCKVIKIILEKTNPNA